MKARVYVSGMTEHSSWTFYRCKNHGVRRFWKLSPFFSESSKSCDFVLNEVSLHICQSTCDFWHWEREYVEYLIQNDVLKGDASTEAYCWAEERREELGAALGKKKLQEEWGRGNGECIAGGGSSSNQGRGGSRYEGRGTDNEMVRKMLVMQKIVVALMFVMLVVDVAIYRKK
jgi:hypothetical protein